MKRDQKGSEQRVLLEKVSAGSSLEDAMRAAGVDMATLCDWIGKDAAFTVALRAKRQEVQALIDLQTLGTVQRALARVNIEFDVGEKPDTALSVLREARVFRGADARPVPQVAPPAVERGD